MVLSYLGWLSRIYWEGIYRGQLATKTPFRKIVRKAGFEAFGNIADLVLDP
jgi:hypothetical protein